MKTRRQLFGLLAAPAALAQVQVSTEQIKGLPAPAPTGDNWQPVPFTGVVNGVNATFALGAAAGQSSGAWRKIAVFLNGVLQYQNLEVASGAPYNYTWTGPGAGGSITFSMPPQPANGPTIPADAIFIRGTL